jgi:hypothetical protein
MGPTALLPLRRKWCYGFLSPLVLNMDLVATGKIFATTRSWTLVSQHISHYLSAVFYLWWKSLKFKSSYNKSLYLTTNCRLFEFTNYLPDWTIYCNSTCTDYRPLQAASLTPANNPPTEILPYIKLLIWVSHVLVAIVTIVGAVFSVRYRFFKHVAMGLFSVRYTFLGAKQFYNWGRMCWICLRVWCWRNSWSISI